MKINLVSLCQDDQINAANYARNQNRKKVVVKLAMKILAAKQNAVEERIQKYSASFFR